eukprot:Tbor_TRINITY_DN4566_c0_g1::TRINITY_DN4566_c0_g1_i1::g.15729::m.15729
MYNLDKHLSYQPYLEPRKDNDIKRPRKGIVSVFDFDGTLFRSPVPSPSVCEKDKKRLLQPVFANGLGWFQNTKTLSSPYISSELYNLLNLIKESKAHQERIKEASLQAIGTDSSVINTSETNTNTTTTDVTSKECLPSIVDKDNPYHGIISEWFIIPIVDTLMEAKRRGDVVCIMTGREEIFRQKVGELITIAGLAPYVDHLFLKEDSRGGTVRYKIDYFRMLCEYYRPETLLYYEDREEQRIKMMKQVEMEKMILRNANTVGSTSESRKNCHNDVDDNTTVSSDKTKNNSDDMVSFEIIMIDPNINNTVFLSSEVENRLVDSLREDAKKSLHKRRW